MGKSKINNKFFGDVSALSPLSDRNGYPMRIKVETDQAKAFAANLPAAFRTVLIDAPPIFSSNPPFIDEPGFNGDDESWFFANHGKSTYVANPDILAIGCSITSSIGIPRRFSWPQIIAAETGQTVNVCSRPASGIVYEIFAAFQMMRYFGKPKTIYALFPDLFRAWVNVHGTGDMSGKTIQEHLVWSSVIGAYVKPKDAIRIMADSQKNASRKADAFLYRDFQGFLYHIPCELVIAKNLQTIRTLDRFCAVNDIQFRFCSWSQHANKVFLSMGLNSFSAPINHFRHDLPMYWSSDETGYEYCSPTEFICPDDDSCGHSPQSDEQKRHWLQAENDWHPGIHSHIHFAEHFINADITNSKNRLWT